MSSSDEVDGHERRKLKKDASSNAYNVLLMLKWLTFSYFRENYNQGFGRPIKDACRTCDELSNKIKNPILNQRSKKVAVAERMVHKRRTKTFYITLQ
ncbi:unnamed protein product [Timema podura]|uniref:Uncharacterized protein n=1 Tax=Timema podura TaxID=61482 RepID=A0ABN7P9F2_TIMPD|nr:unnamed protein product [Timema podura]